MPRLTPLFAATTVVAAIIAGYLWKQLDAERVANAQLQQRLAQFDMNPPPPRRSDAPRVAAAAAPSQAQAPAAPVQAAAARTSGNAARAALSINIRDLFKDPDYREAQRAQLRMQLPQNYPDLAKELGLTPAEAGAFFDLLARQQVDLLANSLSSSEDSDEVRQAAQRAAAELSRTQQGEIEGLLGASKYQQWKDYQQTLGARQQVNQLRTTLASAGQPLADDQAAPLLATLTAEQKRRAEEARSRTYPTDPAAQLDFEEQNLKDTEASNNRVLDAAQSFLSAAQLAALKSSMTQQLAMSRAFQKARRAQLDAGAGQAP